MGVLKPCMLNGETYYTRENVDEYLDTLRKQYEKEIADYLKIIGQQRHKLKILTRNPALSARNKRSKMNKHKPRVCPNNPGSQST